MRTSLTLALIAAAILIPTSVLLPTAGALPAVSCHRETVSTSAKDPSASASQTCTPVATAADAASGGADYTAGSQSAANASAQSGSCVPPVAGCLQPIVAGGSVDAMNGPSCGSSCEPGELQGWVGRLISRGAIHARFYANQYHEQI